MEVTIVFQYRNGEYDGIYGLYEYTNTAERDIRNAEADEAERLKDNPESEVKFTWSYEEGFPVDEEDAWDEDEEEWDDED